MREILVLGEVIEISMINMVMATKLKDVIYTVGGAL
jgi:hypothetical protein